MGKLLGILLAVTFIALPFTTVNAKEKHDPGGVELMFVQNSKSVSFDKGTMTLKGVSPSTTFFSDRPERVAGHLPTTHFLKVWEEGADSFKNDPPNANLSILGEKEGVTNIVVEISNPRLKGSDLTYDIKVLEGEVLKLVESVHCLSTGGPPGDQGREGITDLTQGITDLGRVCIVTGATIPTAGIATSAGRITGRFTNI